MKKNQYYYIELIVSKYNSLRYEDLMLYIINAILKKGAKLKTKSNSSSLLELFTNNLKSRINESNGFIFPHELLNFLIKNSSPLNYKIIDNLVSFLLTHNGRIAAFKLKNNQYIKNTISQNISSILDTIKEE